MNFSGISRDSRLGKLLRWPLRLVPPNTVVPIMQGRLRGMRWIVGSATHGCWLGSYEFAKQQLFSQMVLPGQIVFDIGANVGFYTLLAATLTGVQGKVVAFEPLPRNLLYLRRHIELNHLAQVTIVDAAVGDKAGQAAFDPGTSPSEGHIGSGGDLVVKVVQLDEEVEMGRLPVPHVLKIDVEGSEAQVLYGASRLLANYHPTIFLATHGVEIHETCCQFLINCGYVLAPVGGDSITNTNELVGANSAYIDKNLSMSDS